jgi:hypothetical protein
MNNKLNHRICELAENILEMKLSLEHLVRLFERIANQYQDIVRELNQKENNNE